MNTLLGAREGTRMRAPLSTGHAAGTWELRLEPELRFIKVVRDLLRAELTHRRSADFIETACLLATEVAANAIVHSGRPVLVSVRDDGCVLRLVAHDEGTGFLPPAGMQEVDLDAEGGRGLMLLDACATRWGVHLRPEGGTEVWFELSECTCACADGCARNSGA